MSRTLTTVLADAMTLPVEEREHVALMLLDSVGKAPPDDALDEAWSEEAERRLTEWRDGVASTRSWEEVRADLRAKLRGP
jgi:putative addiction module component (TIGR02574 family)